MVRICMSDAEPPVIAHGHITIGEAKVYLVN